MSLKCKICDKSCKNKQGLHIHVSTTHKLTIPEYYTTVYKRADKYTGELLEFKDFNDYFNRDFKNLNNFISWAKNADHEEVRRLMLKQLKARVAGKELKFAPSHLELKLNKMPSIDMFKEYFGSYYKACQEIDVEPLYPKGIYKNFFDYNPQLEDVKILIDTREKKPLVFKKSSDLKLDFGDYAVGDPYYNYTYVDRKDEADFKSTMTSGFERFKRELDRAKHFDAFLFIVIEGSVESIIKNNILFGSKSNLSFIWHNMRIISHEYAGRCQFIFTGNNGENLFNQLDSDFYDEYDLLYKKYNDLKKSQEGPDLALADKVSKKLWVMRKKVFEPAYESYNQESRQKSQEIIPKLLVYGKKMWETDIQYFLDNHDLGAR